ncbi:MAG: InlB B-repeat-containing protein [Oscillospiraceae bacterium]|nr:InlB B-repeat-containing protein [Oscillospiraceae bacterium]
MKNHKRLLSLAVVAVMLLGLISAGLMASSAQSVAFAPATLTLPTFTAPSPLAEGGLIDELPPLVTFTVPETIWLDQGVSGENEYNPEYSQPVTLVPQTRIVAYSNITNTVGTQTTGEVAFSAAGATNLVITATQLGTTDAAVTAFGTMADDDGDSFTHSLASNVHLPTALAANTAAVIEWVATFELPDVIAGRTFTSRAFSIAYAPNSRITGAALWVQHCVHGTGNALNGWGLMENISGAHMYMAGLQHFELAAPAGGQASTNNNYRINSWTLDPQVNLSNAVLSADPAVMQRSVNDLFGGQIGRHNHATRAFNVTRHEHGQTYGPEINTCATSSGNFIMRSRPTNPVAWLDRDIIYSGFRNDRRFGTSMTETQLRNLYGATGRWATHTAERHVGYMHVDSSRFTNLGQVPGMRFSAIVGQAQGAHTAVISGNTHNRQVLNSRPGGTAQGNVIRLGDYTHATGQYILPAGQVFASHGAQIPVTEGTTNVPVSFEHAHLVEVETWESPAGHIQGLMLGNRLTPGFDFDLIGTDMSTVRAEVLQARHPDQFYTNDNTDFNNRLVTLANWLGNPLLNETDLDLAPANNEELDIGEIAEGDRWEVAASTFTVTVANGTVNSASSYDFEAGETVTIVAGTAPSVNHHFSGWTLTTGTGVTFNNANAETTTFTMPANAVTVTANFALNDQFALTVNGGTADPVGPHFAGATGTVTANAPPANQHFVRWDGDYSILADRTLAETTFTMGAAAATVTAVFEDDDRFTFEVFGYGTTGTAGSPFFEGTSVTATAPAVNAGGYSFLHWVAVGVVLADDTLNTVTFDMPAANVTLTAVFEDTELFTLTVVNGSGSGEHPAGNVPIVAAAPPEGMRFAAWTGDVAAIDDVFSDSTFVTITDADVTVEATFEPIPSFEVTVVNGTGGGMFMEGVTVAIEVQVPANHYFTGWVSADGVTFANAAFAETTFVMLGNAVTVTATYAPDEQFALTVVDGTGAPAGPHFAGATVTITAGAPPANHHFTGWTGDVAFEDATAEITTIVMPANDLAVTANFAPNPQFTVTVVNGSSTPAGPFFAGETVTITAGAPPVGYDGFAGWTGAVAFTNASEATTTFVMPANNVTVTANFTPEGPQPELFAVTVNGGTGGGNFLAGAIVNLAANEPAAGYEFAGWTIAGLDTEGLDLTAATLTFVMPANNVTAQAHFVEEGGQLEFFTVTVVNGTGGGTFLAGNSVTVTANEPAEGYEFAGWTVAGVTIADTSATSLTFTMPANAVTATANFDEVIITPPPGYTVTVTNGPGSDTFQAGDTVTIVAAGAPTGYRFAGWNVVGVNLDGVDLSETTLTFVMPNNAVTVTATFEPIPSGGGGDTTSCNTH